MPNNPAGRLLKIFERMREVQSDRAHHSRNAAEGWATVLETDFGDHAALFRRLSNVALLTQAVETSVGKLEGGIQPQNLISWIPKFFGPWQHFNLAGTFDHFTHPVDETMLSILRIADDLLSHQFPEPSILVEELKKIQDDLRKLAGEISEASLEQSFKAYLLHLLEIIENAISDYRVKGFTSLRAGLEQSVGAFVIDRQHFQESQTNPWGKKVLNVLGVYALVVTSVLATLQLPHEIQKYLPDHSAPSQQQPATAATSSPGK